MRSLLILLLACSALAQSPNTKQFVTHVQAANAALHEKHYPAAEKEFRLALEFRPDAQVALLGLIQAYALSGDLKHRDAEIAHVRALIDAGKLPKSLRYVREQFTVAHKSVVASEYPYVTLWRHRYTFETEGSQFDLVLRERRFLLLSGDAIVRSYDRGEPSYKQVVADVKSLLAHKPIRNGKYALAKTPAEIEPFPITLTDPADPRLALKAHEVAIEYIAHSSFRIHTSGGTRILLDPYASRVWLGYDFPSRIAADEILITHPHYDHDADTLLGGQPAPWAPDVRVLRDPGNYKLNDVTITGIAGKHADPWGKEFGQKNTIWLLDVDGLRIVHLGDNGPLTDANVQALGRVDILLMPIDGKYHILKQPEIDAIRNALHPRVVIPMHYRLPDLESSPDSPDGLGDIDPWLATQQNVMRLESNIAIFDAASLTSSSTIMVLPHSPKVKRP